MSKKSVGPKVLLLDIETSPVLGYVWSLWENNVALNQIHSDWHVLSWSAKWLGDPASKMMYQDQRGVKKIEDDRNLLRGIWKLLDEADILITQNGKSFDTKKLNARFVINGFQPPSGYKHIDTRLLAKKHFAFTSTKLEYMADKLCTKYKKLKHAKFAGFELWRACLADNIEAWKEMEKYNKHDVLALEELYQKLVPWDDAIDFSLYSDSIGHICKCGSSEHEKRGWHYTQAGKFQRYRCHDCGTWTRDKTNMLSKQKIASLRPGAPRTS